MLVSEIHAEARAVVAARVTVGSGDPHRHTMSYPVPFRPLANSPPTTGQHFRRQVVAGVEHTLRSKFC